MDCGSGARDAMDFIVPDLTVPMRLSVCSSSSAREGVLHLGWERALRLKSGGAAAGRGRRGAQKKASAGTHVTMSPVVSSISGAMALPL